MVKDIKKVKSVNKKGKSKKESKKIKKISKKNNHNKIVIKEKTSLKRKWNEKDPTTGEKKSFIKGKITEEEAKKIERALCEYAFEKRLTDEELLSIITDKLSNNNKIWPIISECLPNRTVQSIHNFCHRKYHPNNYKGFWTSQEEKDLINLVKEYGKKWVLIASKMDRTSINVKDKYKELGEENYKNITKDITLIKILKLLKAIRNYLLSEEKLKKYDFFLYNYKFSETVEKKYDNVFKIIKEENKFLIDSCLKEDMSNIIIKNTLKKILNKEKLYSLIEDKIEIPWSIISKTLEFYSVDTCRNVFKKILNLFNIESISAKKKDLLLVNKILDLDYENLEDINWEYIKAKRKPSENKERMEELIKNFDPFGIKNFRNNLIKIKEELENELNKEDNDDDSDKEFNEEIEQRNKNNIIKIYQKYKLKRGVE